MPRAFHRQKPQRHGAATVELAIALPFVTFLTLVGIFFGYYIYVRVILTAYVNEKSEDLALESPVVSLISTGIDLFTAPPQGLNTDRFHGFSFSLPIPNRPFVASFACYSIPIPFPHLPTGPAAGNDQAPPASPPPKDLLALIERVREMEAKGAGWLDQAESAVDQAILVKNLAVAATSGVEDRQYQTYRYVGGWAIEGAMEHLCPARPGEWVVTARAVAWSEQTKGLR